MAAEFLRSRGVDLDAELSRIQEQASLPSDNMKGSPPTYLEATSNARHPDEPESSMPSGSVQVDCFQNVSLPNLSPGSRWNVFINDSQISSVESYDPDEAPRVARAHHNVVNGHAALLAPSLCHPHLHLDKAYLLSHPKYAHLQLQRGDFKEAMDLTGRAKANFEEWDLLERGQRVIDESVAAGVTHMRAFVEVDAVVGMKCLDVGIELKKRNESRCVVQICAFAQLPLFSPSDRDEDGSVIRSLMSEAAGREEVDVVGSAPYVEGSREKMEWNVEWMVDGSADFGKHLDFHLDYNLDPKVEPMMWYVIEALKRKRWNDRTGGEKSIVLGHCTRLTLFEESEWKRLRKEIVDADLPISFVGLPTSDMFILGKTLNVPMLIKDHGIDACIGMNNIGNAFTPQGSCDPLTLACNGVGVYQAGTKSDAELLYECVSTRARRAIGLHPRERKGNDDYEVGLDIRGGGSHLGNPANLVLFRKEDEEWRTRRSVSEAVYLYDHCRGRKGFLEGRPTGG